MLLVKRCACLWIHLVIPERRYDLGAILDGPVLVNEHLLNLEVDVFVCVWFTIFLVQLSILEEADHIVENVNELLGDNYADQLLLEIAFD